MWKKEKRRAKQKLGPDSSEGELHQLSLLYDSQDSAHANVNSVSLAHLRQHLQRQARSRALESPDSAEEDEVDHLPDCEPTKTAPTSPNNDHKRCH